MKGDVIEPDNSYDIPPEQLERLTHSYYQTKVVLDQDEANRIEQDNRVSECNIERRKCITASNVHSIASMRPTTNKEALTAKC